MASEETGAKGSCSVSLWVLSSKKGVLKKRFGESSGPEILLGLCIYRASVSSCTDVGVEALFI